MIFTQDELPSLLEVKDTLHLFGEMSGLIISFEKSELFLSGMNITEKEALAFAVGIGLGTLPVSYLGVSLSPVRLVKADFAPLDKIRAKLANWLNRFLLASGKIQLVTSVIYGMVNSWSMTFVLPSFVLKEIDSLCSRFIWQYSVDKTLSHWVSWEAISKPKEEGGPQDPTNSRTTHCLLAKANLAAFDKSGITLGSLGQELCLQGTHVLGGWDSTPSTWNLKKLIRIKDLFRQYSKV
ncbi:PREDICTED: uncharacterized protein LOC104815438 [Tarenaya hassleriana]|uniref:uncharacterized protein LOC104815438 n=1 Tax=Tarenaya hassleriana TaxID=28532 RepID=UPI00053C5C86|nr:PREDICTED: uncharacterized protein LOC104815438 [Tarenaya hassleriana]